MRGPKEIVLMGNFDGVHVGHQSLIQAAKDKLGREGGVSLLNFIPHTGAFFGRKNRFILSPSLREFSLRKAGVSHLYNMPFGKVSSLSSADFVQNVLFEEMNFKSLMVGENFRFGKDRRGSFGLLKSLCSPYGMEVIAAPLHCLGGKVVSSTLVAEFIRKGDMETALSLLGRLWTIEGKVLRGRELGKKLGFPTVNLSMDGLVTPVFGVYAAYAQILGDSKVYKAAANLGIKPTVEKDGRLLLEAHILGFDGNLYGKIVRISLVKFIRKEMLFPSLKGLKAKMKEDVALINQVSMDTPRELW